MVVSDIEIRAKLRQAFGIYEDQYALFLLKLIILKKRFDLKSNRFFMLSHQDSNLDRQNQKLQCYHYTMRQSCVLSLSQKRCKDNVKIFIDKILYFLFCNN